jgi:hypothetical protein
VERLCHISDYVGLRNGLAVTDGEGCVTVGHIPHIFRYEPVTGHLTHRLQHALVGDAPPRQLSLHHLVAGFFKAGWFVKHGRFPSHCPFPFNHQVRDLRVGPWETPGHPCLPQGTLAPALQVQVSADLARAGGTLCSICQATLHEPWR